MPAQEWRVKVCGVERLPNADRIGYKMLEKRFWDRRLGILKELERAALIN